MKLKLSLIILLFLLWHNLLFATNEADLQITINEIQAISVEGNSLEITVDPFNYTRLQNVLNETVAKISYSHNVASEIIAKPTVFGDPGQADFSLSVYLNATGGGNTIYFKESDLDSYSATKLYSSTSADHAAANAALHIGIRNPADSGYGNWWKLIPGTYNYTIGVKIQDK